MSRSRPLTTAALVFLLSMFDDETRDAMKARCMDYGHEAAARELLGHINDYERALEVAERRRNGL